jgi:hypothetical protein
VMNHPQREIDPLTVLNIAVFRDSHCCFSSFK